MAASKVARAAAVYSDLTIHNDSSIVWMAKLSNDHTLLAPALGAAAGFLGGKPANIIVTKGVGWLMDNIAASVGAVTLHPGQSHTWTDLQAIRHYQCTCVFLRVDDVPGTIKAEQLVMSLLCVRMTHSIAKYMKECNLSERRINYTPAAPAAPQYGGAGVRTFILAAGDDPYKICKREFGNGMLYKLMEYEGKMLTEQSARHLPDGACLLFRS